MTKHNSFWLSPNIRHPPMRWIVLHLNSIGYAVLNFKMLQTKRPYSSPEILELISHSFSYISINYNWFPKPFTNGYCCFSRRSESFKPSNYLRNKKPHRIWDGYLFVIILKYWLRRQDLNLRPSIYELNEIFICQNVTVRWCDLKCELCVWKPNLT